MENNSGHHCPIKVTVNVLPEEHRHLLSGKPLRSADRDEIARLNARIARLQAEVRAWRHWNEMDQLVGTEDEIDVNANSAWGLLELDRAAVDQHKDLEPPCQQ